MTRALTPIWPLSADRLGPRYSVCITWVKSTNTHVFLRAVRLAQVIHTEEYVDIVRVYPSNTYFWQPEDSDFTKFGQYEVRSSVTLHVHPNKSL